MLMRKWLLLKLQILQDWSIHICSVKCMQTVELSLYLAESHYCYRVAPQLWDCHPRESRRWDTSLSSVSPPPDPRPFPRSTSWISTPIREGTIYIGATRGVLFYFFVCVPVCRFLSTLATRPRGSHSWKRSGKNTSLKIAHCAYDSLIWNSFRRS